MSQEKLSLVLRMFDDETQLIERADKKAIALLSIVGVFMVFFLVYYRLIPVNSTSIALIAAYFTCAIFAIASLVMSIRPRIYHGERNGGAKKENLPPGDPTFFTEICKFPNVAAYREALEAVISDEQTTFNTYTKQVFHLAQINAVKYRHLRRGTFLAIATVAIELSLVIYLFTNFMGVGLMPPLV
jgi:hypothetical protein